MLVSGVSVGLLNGRPQVISEEVVKKKVPASGRSAFSCGRGSNESDASTNRIASESSQAEVVVKPKPVILGINAATSGMFSSYYLILERWRVDPARRRRGP